MSLYLVLLLASTLPGVAVAQDTPTWTYHVPPPGAPGEHPIPTVLPLGTEPAEDLKLGFQPEGEFQRYGQLRYGDASSTRIAVMLDELVGRETRLYVDSGRDRVLEAEDRVDVDGLGRWVTNLAVETAVDGKLTHVPRRVLFELGARGGLFTHATMGALEGEVQLGDRTVAARRVDADGSGFFTDERDHLWIDVDGDGEYSPFGELFLYGPLLPVDGERYALRSDRLGERLALERLDGTGSIDVRIPGEAGRVRAMNVLLVGRDGSAVGVETNGETIEVPVGEYRLGMVTFALADPDGGKEWSFVFSEPYGGPEHVWYPVARGEKAEVDPVGELDFDAGVGRDLEECEPGQRIGGNPVLLTGDGLLINSAYRGRTASRWSGGGLQARVRLLDVDGAVLDEATSGFA